MNNAEVIHHTIQVLGIVLLLSLPPILVAAGVGILVSLFQALTQIQEQTLSFCVKLIAVSFTLIATARWVGIELYNYALLILQSTGSL